MSIWQAVVEICYARRNSVPLEDSDANTTPRKRRWKTSIVSQFHAQARGSETAIRLTSTATAMTKGSCNLLNLHSRAIMTSEIRAMTITEPVMAPMAAAVMPSKLPWKQQLRPASQL